MGTMTADMHPSDVATKEMLSGAFEARLAKGSLSNITFFDMLFSLAKSKSEEDKRALCGIIHQLDHKVFDLFEKDGDHVQKESLMELVYLAIEDRIESAAEADMEAGVSQDMPLHPSFSATFPGGKTVQVDTETASLNGVRKLARAFSHQQPNLASASLRRDVLTPLEAEMRMESSDDHFSKKATCLIETATTEV